MANNKRQKEKAARRLAFDVAQRTPIKRSDINKLVKPEKDGQDWIILHDGKEFRASKRQDVLDSWAVVNNYRITNGV